MTGAMLIGGEWITGSADAIQSFDAASGQAIDPAFGGAQADDVAKACQLAEDAFDSFRDTSPHDRAAFLDAIADAILDLGDALIVRVMQESGLPRGRLEGERGRTVGQLRLFASVLREGSWAGVRIDPAMPDRTPAPRSDLRLRHVALGPVAVFGASNFPLAFSVAGGDTASALAAGCPVVVKAHNAHLGTSALIASAVDKARRACGLPAGIFSMLVGRGTSIGTALVADPHIKAVGFTGSRSGGMALMDVAASRPEPIPVYAEMSSINPVLLFPHALANRGAAIARAFAGSLTLGAGQFCTNPGLVIAIDGPELDAFIAEAGQALWEIPGSTMLTPGIHRAYNDGLANHGANARLAAQGPQGTGLYEAQSHLFETSAADFLANSALHAELFGPAALVVRCPDLAALRAVVARVEGQLTIALHIDKEDEQDAATLMPLLERKAGRLLANGFGTGVEVAHAMVHGGPFPATSDGRSTSVGSLAIARFLRPVSYQDLPQALLPEALRDGNPLGLPRRVDGTMES
ncbi:MAG: aldehyde dehydrogenase (NADP(+)) [Sphingobium sp.]